MVHKKRLAAAYFISKIRRTSVRWCDSGRVEEAGADRLPCELGRRHE
jgi:hypothetical protein